MRIDLVTCRSHPVLSPSDSLLAAELTRRGHNVRTLVWNDAAGTPATESDLVVLRSNWDYHESLPEFERWLAVVDQSSARLVNCLPLVNWGLRKSYLLYLAERGVPIPRTALLDAALLDSGTDATMPDWVRPDEPVVVKPEVGASGVGVELIQPARIGAIGERPSGPTGRVVIQEYIEDIAAGEWALVFFGAEYSHAFQRVPPTGEFRVNNQYGGTVRAAEPDARLKNFARDVIDKLPSVPVYARIDTVLTAHGPLVMEVEINEPSLRLDIHPDALLAAYDNP